MKESVRIILEEKVDSLWPLHFKIPKEIAEKFIEKDNKRIKCTINDTLRLHSAMLSNSDGYFIILSKPNAKKLNIQLGEHANLEIEKDASPYGMPMPEEMEMVLDSEMETLDYFEKLSPGKQRSLIHLVRKIKNPDIKVRRALSIAEHLKREKGVLDFKKLNEVIKEFNQREKLF
jgi:hypothetical protein